MGNGKTKRVDFDSAKVQAWLVSGIQLFVEKPEKVACIVHDTPSTVIFVVDVDSVDYGKVIGKQGQMAQNLRGVIRAIAGCFDKRLILEFSMDKEKKT